MGRVLQTQIDLCTLETHKQHTPFDIISGNMGKYNFTEVFILSINLLLLLFNQVIKDRLSLKALNSSLTASAGTQAKRRFVPVRRAIVFQPLNLHSCLETSMTASGEAEPDLGCHWQGGGEKTYYCSWPFKALFSISTNVRTGGRKLTRTPALLHENNLLISQIIVSYSRSLTHSHVAVSWWAAWSNCEERRVFLSYQSFQAHLQMYLALFSSYS